MEVRESQPVVHPTNRTKVTTGDGVLLDISLPIVRTSASGLESLPIEVRHMIYEQLLPNMLTPESIEMDSFIYRPGTRTLLVALIWRPIVEGPISSCRKFGRALTTTAIADLRSQQRCAVAVLHVNKLLRYELATALFDCLTFWTWEHATIPTFAATLMPITRGLIRHIQVPIYYRSKPLAENLLKRLCEALQQLSGLQSLLIYGCEEAEDLETNGSIWKHQYLHALRAIREACPALIDAYYVLNNPKHATTEITLSCPGRATKDNLIRFDADEEYDKWLLADKKKREADKEDGISLEKVEAEKEGISGRPNSESVADDDDWDADSDGEDEDSEDDSAGSDNPDGYGSDYDSEEGDGYD